MAFVERNITQLIRAGTVAGFVQVIAGITMYLAGIYFTRYSALVNLGLLIVCVVTAIVWLRAKCFQNSFTYQQALKIGVATGLCSGVIYGVYNVISVSFFYPHFLDDFARFRLARLVSQGHVSMTFEEVRASVSLMRIAVTNCINFTIWGSVISAIAAIFLRGHSRVSPITSHGSTAGR